MVFAEEIDKDEYRYDSKGNLLEDLYYEWNTDHWENSMKYEFTYDTDGNKTLNVSYLWNGSGWENTAEKDEYTYDNHGDQIQHINSLWVGNQYESFIKNMFTYDINRNNTQVVQYLWDGSEWANWSKDEFIYDNKNMLTMSVIYDWDGSQWINTNKYDFIYDSNDQMTEIISAEWDGDNWMKTGKYTDIYDSNGKITESYFSKWEAEQWVIFGIINYTYDSSGNLVLYVVNLEDSIIYREESVYDELGNRTENAIFELNMDSGLLEKALKNEYTYDNSFSYEDLILPIAFIEVEGGFDEELIFKHKLMHLINYEGDGESWVFDSDYFLEYSEQEITGIRESKSENQLSLYPNPANGQVTFTLDSAVDRFRVEIFDIQGKMVISQTVENNKPVSIESLHEEIYFYRLNAQGQPYSGKLMVKKHQK
ncbi:MAG: T9SS type A sorting domain-containing protein [Bacteroidales bacterium]